MDLRGVRSLKTKWVQNTSPEVMNSVFPKANFFFGHPVVQCKQFTSQFNCLLALSKDYLIYEFRFFKIMITSASQN